MRVRADQDMVGEPDRMSGTAAQHGLFHDDAVPADGDGAPFGDEHRAEQHAALGADGHIAADGGGGGDVGGLVNVGSLALMFEQHGCPSPLRLEIGAWPTILFADSLAPDRGRAASGSLPQPSRLDPPWSPAEWHTGEPVDGPRNGRA